MYVSVDTSLYTCRSFCSLLYLSTSHSCTNTIGWFTYRIVGYINWTGQESQLVANKPNEISQKKTAKSSEFSSKTLPTNQSRDEDFLAFNWRIHLRQARKQNISPSCKALSESLTGRNLYNYICISLKTWGLALIIQFNKGPGVDLWS